MANYDSAYTGQQVDDAVNIALGFTHTPNEIDTAVTSFDTIVSTPSDIDDTVDYVDTLISASIDASSIASALGWIGSITVSPIDIDSVVNKFNLVNSQPSQIDATVDLIVNNTAPNGKVLTSNGNGSSTWQTPTGITEVCEHVCTFSYYDGDNYNRFSFEWFDGNETNVTKDGALQMVRFAYRNANCPKLTLGVVWENNTAIYVNGIYYDNASQKYVLTGDDYPNNYKEYTDFNGWTYTHNLTIR